MDFWIIRNGEKLGPIPDYELRSRIGRGEVDGSTPAWHQGLTAWTPLRELAQFEREFAAPGEEAAAPDTDDIKNAEVGPPPVPSTPAHPHLARRFWARWLDLHLYAGCWWLAIWAAGQDVQAVLTDPWLILLHYVPWFAIEAVFIHRWGTTPGKWLLRLRVVNTDGSYLSAAQSVRRCTRVLFLGIGMGWGIVSVICQLFAWFSTRRTGSSLWDLAGGHRIETAPLRLTRIVGFAASFVLALQLQMIVIAPYAMESAAKQFPWIREMTESNPPWHLPPRK
jgi:uncharacterized RDD family membrane protein YckC